MHEGRKLHIVVSYRQLPVHINFWPPELFVMWCWLILPQSIDDLSDSRVLCALLNSFIPNLFTTEVFLNDRWTINTVLRTMEKMLYIDTPMDSEDFTEVLQHWISKTETSDTSMSSCFYPLQADPMTICAYLCTFFMIAFKFRQSKAVFTRVVGT